MGERVPLDSGEEALWRSLAQIIITLPRALEDQFARENGVTLTDYAALVALSEAPEDQMRLSELAAATALSLSRISRVVDNLNRRGLVRKWKCPQDGRAANAALTPQGRETLTAAYPGHLDLVRALVFDHLDAAEVASTAPILARIAAVLRQETSGAAAQRAAGA